jgi:hypothetical protein
MRLRMRMIDDDDDDDAATTRHVDDGTGVARSIQHLPASHIVVFFARAGAIA